jgi:hypothetical protein
MKDELICGTCGKKKGKKDVWFACHTCGEPLCSAECAGAHKCKPKTKTLADCKLDDVVICVLGTDLVEAWIIGITSSPVGNLYKIHPMNFGYDRWVVESVDVLTIIKNVQDKAKEILRKEFEENEKRQDEFKKDILKTYPFVQFVD